jgi:hypothetical protein
MRNRAVNDFIQNEISSARQARQDGLEGRARVCARRAAGAAAREYLSRTLPSSPKGTAYDLLGTLAELPEAPEAARNAAHLLRLRVNEDYSLSVGVDLIETAIELIAALDLDAPGE